MIILTGCALIIAGGAARLGFLRAALWVNRSMLKLMPRRAHIFWFHRGLLYDRADDASRAIECFVAGRAEATETVMFDMEIARVYERTGKIPAAISIYQQLLETSPELDESFRRAVKVHLDNLSKRRRSVVRN
jgi:lipopolysaccharide biosynthesis regulator YciM